MAKSHRLDTLPGVDSYAEGAVHRNEDSANRQPDSRFPKGSDTDYHHDQQATAQHSPGPFHGDNLVTQQTDQELQKVDYVYSHEDASTEAKAYRRSNRTFDAVSVRVLEMPAKERSTRHQINVQEVQTGTLIRVLGKDPTRSVVYLHVNGGNGYIADSNITISVADAVAAQMLFPIPSGTASPIKLTTEEELWVYCPTDASGVCYVQMYCEYTRGTETREEQFIQ